MNRHLLISIAFTAMAGCVSIEKYPDQWDALDASARSDKCPNVSGTYDNVGETGDGRRAWLAISLDDITKHSRELGQARYNFWKDLAASKMVQIALTDDPTFTIKVMAEGGQHEWALSSARFHCTANALTIQGEAIHGADNGADIGTDSLDLYRSGERLILNRRSARVGFLLFIPVAGYGSSWARYSLTKDQ